MQTEKPRFDKIVLAVVVLVGVAFIGVSLLSVARNGGALQQASVSSITALKTKKTNVPVNGICGSSSGKVFESSPTTNLCSTGNPSVVILDEKDIGKFYAWQCLGINGGITASCNATANINNSSKRINGECGDSNGKEISSMPDSQEMYCRVGNYVKGDCSIPVYDSKSKKWKSNCAWVCSGDNGGAGKDCSAILIK